MAHGVLMLFALEASAPLGQRIGHVLETPLAAHEEREFEDGEHKARPLTRVRGADVYVIQSLYGDSAQSPNDKLCRLLFFLGALHDAGAERVTAIVPYLAYARKDRRTKLRDPVTTRYVAQMFEAAGLDHIVTLDVHNLAAFENAFRCGKDSLEPTELFAEHVIGRFKRQPIAVVSPDPGGIKRADRLREAIERKTGQGVGFAVVEKYRSEGAVTGGMLSGSVEGRAVVILDDIIGTGTTLRRAAGICREAGAASIIAAATHGLFISPAAGVVNDPVLDGVVVTDSVPPFRLPRDLVKSRLTIIETAPLLAEAIAARHGDGSIGYLRETRASERA